MANKYFLITSEEFQNHVSELNAHPAWNQARTQVIIEVPLSYPIPPNIASFANGNDVNEYRFTEERRSEWEDENDIL